MPSPRPDIKALPVLWTRGLATMPLPGFPVPCKPPPKCLQRGNVQPPAKPPPLGVEDTPMTPAMPSNPPPRPRDEGAPTPAQPVAVPPPLANALPKALADPVQPSIPPPAKPSVTLKTPFPFGPGRTERAAGGSSWGDWSPAASRSRAWGGRSSAEPSAPPPDHSRSCRECIWGSADRTWLSPSTEFVKS